MIEPDRSAGFESARAAREAAGTLEPVVIDIHGLSLSFDEVKVLCSISFEVREGEALAIVGPSGAGKSTILKLILRLLVPDSGEIVVHGQDMVRLSFEEVLKARRRMGMVFQEAALFDSLTVFENVAYPLREHTRMAEEEIEDRVDDALRFVDLSLEEFADRLPAELSGGQKKRVGIARAIVYEPSILLYDEPTGGLDPLTTQTIVDLMRRLQSELEVTSIVVSHDVRSVFRVADRVAMLKDCEIIFYGTPQEMINSEEPEVREFIQ